jgi:deoxyribonuclease-4
MPTDYRHQQGIDILVQDLNVSVKLGAIGVIIHMGNDTEKRGEKRSKENYINGVKKALELSNKDSILILETGTGCGKEVSSSLKELGEIRKNLTLEEQKRVKFCLDTCHMFAYGYNLNNTQYIDMFNIEIDRYLGWNNIAVIHLNDSKDFCGAKKDHHMDIGKGSINFDCLMKFIHFCVLNKIPIVLETPCHTYDNGIFSYKQQMDLIRIYYNSLYCNKKIIAK